MRDVSNSRGARTIGLALAACLVAFEAALVLGVGAFGVPGLLLVRFSGDAHAVLGGETVVSKLAEAARALNRASIPLTPEPSGDQRLVGLGDKIPWERAPQAEEQSPRPKVFAEGSAAGAEVLPWDAVEPFDPGGSSGTTSAETAPATEAPPLPAAAPAPAAALPAASDVERWVKAKATKFNSEDKSRGRLFHFELWLEPPAIVKERLVAVAYTFETPAVMPQAQISSEQKTGFRVAFGGLTCAEKITLTLKFSDGQSQQVAVDGCRLLG